ncbi:hypothetical protein CTAYLR_000832 [Chrysophaeum taylorii]|uniref:2-methoxy-6-polyprenyl-1,4-benzoquinol methylase, mitochondrial n=1 Tax=Chrysophaeum taylorii TaxID=2483200 RepID=A0AAD7UP95_9STRA|nr:hypothetical protein CTAYLR_000832 [Chrysophaeum taylorii]
MRKVLPCFRGRRHFAEATTTTTTHFGARTVPREEKESLVSGVFTSVASNYDVMNDLMSGGMHRLWKDDFVRRLGLGACARATGKAPRLLDVAGGTGDIAFRAIEDIAKWLPPPPDDPPPVVVSDVNADMLEVGRHRAEERAVSPRCLVFDLGNAERLPYDDATFDYVTISFGLRNVTDIDAALREMRRVLQPGGRFECLEFSQVSDPLIRAAYDLYSKRVIPELGARVARDRPAYEYLVESIRKHPAQLELLSRLAAAGFARPTYRNITFGVVAVHSGYAP